MSIKKLLFLFSFTLLSFSQSIFAQCGWSDVAVGDYHTLAIRTDGTLWSWGRNNFGQLGHGNTTQQNSPKKVGNSTWKKIAAGYGYSLGLKTNGTLWAWGNNSAGVFGNGTTNSSNVPVQIGSFSDWTNISAASSRSMGVRNGIWTYTWGNGYWHQLGNGSTTTQLSPVLINTIPTTPPFVQHITQTSLSSSDYFLGAMVTTWGDLWVWGNNNNRGLGISNTPANQNIQTPVEIYPNSSTWKMVSQGSGHTFGLLTNGELWVAGHNNNGALGLGPLGNPTVSSFVRMGTEHWKDIRTAWQSSWAIKSDGTLWAWGGNPSGVLGTGSLNPQYSNSPLSISADNKWDKLAQGPAARHAAAIKTDGTLWLWGKDDYGQLGIGNGYAFQTSPMQVAPCYLNMSTAVTNLSCAGSQDGQIQVNPNYAHTNFSVSWKKTGTSGSLASANFNSSSFTISNLEAGTYDVTLTDGCGCSTSAQVSLTQPAPINVTASASPSNVLCGPGASVILSGAGAASYSWSGGASNGVAFVPTTSGLYTVVGTDVNGCTASSNVNLTFQPVQPSVIVSAEIVGGISALQNNDTICRGETIKLSASGADTYAWTSGATLSNLSGDSTFSSSLTNAQYIVTGSTAGGCMDTDTFNVVVKGGPNPNIVSEGFEASTLSSSWSIASSQQLATIITTGSPEGSNHLRLTTTGGAGAYSGLSRSFTPSAISACSWRVRPTSNNNTGYFILKDGTTLNNAALFTAYFTSAGNLKFLGNGGVQYNFPAPVNNWYHVELKNWNWTTKTFDIYINGILRRIAFPFRHQTSTPAGRIYMYNPGTTTTYFDDIQIKNVPSSNINIHPAGVLCDGDSVRLTLNGTGISSTSWSGGILDNTFFALNSNATYTVIGKDIYGCVLATDSVSLIVNPLPVITTMSSPNATICSGDSLTLTASGVSSYIWTGGVTNNATFVPASSAAYIVTGTDSIGCQITDTVDVIVKASTSNSISPVACATYTSPSNNVYTATGTYTEVFTNAVGCDSVLTINLTIHPLPSAPIVDAVDRNICDGQTADFLITGNVGDLIDYVIVGPEATNVTGFTLTSSPQTITIPTPTGNNRLRILKVVDGTTACEQTWPNSNTAPNRVIRLREPVITGPTSVCLGGTISLTASPNSNNNNTWLSSNANATTDASTTVTSIITGTAAGTATINYTNRWGCDVDYVITVDTAAPVISCPADVTLRCDEDNSSANTGMATATTTACGPPTITQSETTTQDADPNNTAHYNYVITRTWSATNLSGNSSSCVQTITVQDVTPPVITCPSPITLNNDAGNCGALVNFAATAIDACSGSSVSIAYSQNPNTVFNVGTTTVTATATDISGNSSTCTFDVTVLDTENPIASCKHITIDLDSMGQLTLLPTDIDNGSSDNCGIQSMLVSPSTFSCADTGLQTVTLTVTDLHGNTAVCTSQVTITSWQFLQFQSCADVVTTNCTGTGATVNWNPPLVQMLSSCAQACPGGSAIAGLTYKGTHNGHSYYISDAKYKWDQAITAAQNAGGHLVSINDAAENTFVQSILPTINTYNNVWIGYTDEVTEGNFLWVNGDMSTYTNWHANEPNNVANGSCSDPDYVVLRRNNGRWYDRQDCKKAAYVLEIPCTNGITVAQTSGPASGSTFASNSTTPISYIAYNTSGDTAYCNFNVVVDICDPIVCPPPVYSTNYEYIDQIELNTINNTSGNDNGYGDYTSQSTTLLSGGTYPITMTPGYTGNQYTEFWTVFVDWNYDGDFSGPGEMVAQGSNGASPVVKNIAVPTTAIQNKPLRMRVIMNWLEYVTDPCAVSSTTLYGEVEDYSINVMNGSSKTLPTAKTETVDGKPGGDIEFASIYPNPVQVGADEIMVKYRLLEGSTVELKVHTIDGKLLTTKTILNSMAGENRANIALPELASGVYTVIVSTKNGSDLIKFVVN